MTKTDLAVEARKKVNVNTLMHRKKKGQKVVFITAYDYPFARLADQSGIDMILVGDSLGMTTLGHKTTLPVTMEDMIRHSQAVTRATEFAFVIGDMPYMSYQASDRDAVLNAGRFYAEAGCDAVKLEGGKEIAPRVKAMVDAGIVVMGHLGLTPQRLAQMGGYRVQGKTFEEYETLVEDALILQEAGASFLLIEAVPRVTAKKLRDNLKIPVYGIGAGDEVDGQLVIIHDILGLFEAFQPKFVKQYTNVSKIVKEALSTYAHEVRSNKFPTVDHMYPIDPAEAEKILESKAIVVDQKITEAVIRSGRKPAYLDK
jgi:3-methyl-2-oxobutanoate hydroxymethyltransferase